MHTRRIGILLAVAILVGGAVWYSGVTTSEVPTLTVENEDTTTYDVTAYTVEDRRTAMLTNFHVTTRDGERRLATGEQLVWPEGFRNVTLADEGVPTTSVTVGPGENETTPIDGCDSGVITVFIVEDIDTNEIHEWTNIVTCAPYGNEHRMTLRDGGMSM